MGIAAEQLKHYQEVRARLMGRSQKTVVIASQPRPQPTLAPKPYTAKLFRISGKFGLEQFSVIAPVSWGKYQRPTIARIIAEVCKYYEVDKIDILSDRRTKELVTPRFMAMYLARKLTASSFPVISLAIGRRDHTTAMHGSKKMALLVKRDPMLAEAAKAITSRVNGIS